MPADTRPPLTVIEMNLLNGGYKPVPTKRRLFQRLVLMKKQDI